MNIRKPVRILLLSLLLALPAWSACSPSAHGTEEAGVIFSADQAKELGLGGWLLPGGQTPEYWSPSKQDILTLEASLAAFLRQNAGSFPAQDTPVWEKLDGYNRQYVGVVLDGRKIIYANYFCRSAGIDWKKEFVFVLDGGACYFQFQYDAASGEFFDLRVNGEA